MVATSYRPVMAFKVTFEVNGSVASINGVEKAEMEDGRLRCIAGSDEQEALITMVPLDSLRSITEEESSETAATVVADPQTPGVTSTHTVILTVSEEIDDFDYFRIDYSAGEAHTGVEHVDEDDVLRFGLDTDGDGEVEKSIMTGDWSVSHGGSGHTLRVRNQEWIEDLSPGDELLMEYENVVNPDKAGTYEVDLILNGHQKVSTAYTVGGGDADDGSS